GPQSTFGSEQISGDCLEYLPGEWYRNVENRGDLYRCLLFDLWCNHSDSRQALFQTRSPRVLKVYFIDHDRMFSFDDDIPLPRRISRTRYLDLRLYKQAPKTVFSDLRKIADRII